MWQKLKKFLFGLFYENHEPSLTRFIIASAFLAFIIGTAVDIIMTLFGKVWHSYQAFATITGGGSISAKIADRITNTVTSQAWGSPAGRMPAQMKNPPPADSDLPPPGSTVQATPAEYPCRRISLDELRTLLRQAGEALAAAAAAGVKVYIHWTGGHYHQFFPNYHLLVDAGGELYATVEDLSLYLAHTYKRNSGAIALAALCAANARSYDDLGPEAPTDAQIETLAQSMAVISRELELPVAINSFMTHAEAADNMDGEDPGYAPNGFPEGRYGPANSGERWDFWVVKAGDPPGSGGDILRGKANWYLQNGIGC